MLAGRSPPVGMIDVPNGRFPLCLGPKLTSRASPSKEGELRLMPADPSEL